MRIKTLKARCFKIRHVCPQIKVNRENKLIQMADKDFKLDFKFIVEIQFTSKFYNDKYCKNFKFKPI